MHYVSLLSTMKSFHWRTSISIRLQANARIYSFNNSYLINMFGFKHLLVFLDRSKQLREVSLTEASTTALLIDLSFFIFEHAPDSLNYFYKYCWPAQKYNYIHAAKRQNYVNIIGCKYLNNTARKTN